MTLTHIRKTSLYTNRNIEKVGACTANTDNKLYSNVSYVGPSSECLDSLWQRARRETLDYTIRIDSTPTFLLYSSYTAHYVYIHFVAQYWTPCGTSTQEDFRFRCFSLHRFHLPYQYSLTLLPCVPTLQVFESTLKIMKNINLQLFHVSLSFEIFRFTGMCIQMWWTMTSHGLHSILTCWKIVFIFKMIEWNHLKLCILIQITKVNNIVIVLWSPRSQTSFQTP